MADELLYVHRALIFFINYWRGIFACVKHLSLKKVHENFMNSWNILLHKTPLNFVNFWVFIRLRIFSFWNYDDEQNFIRYIVQNCSL